MELTSVIHGLRPLAAQIVIRRDTIAVGHVVGLVTVVVDHAIGLDTIESRRWTGVLIKGHP